MTCKKPPRNGRMPRRGVRWMDHSADEREKESIARRGWIEREDGLAEPEPEPAPSALRPTSRPAEQRIPHTQFRGIGASNCLLLCSVLSFFQPSPPVRPPSLLLFFIIIMTKTPNRRGLLLSCFSSHWPMQLDDLAYLHLTLHTLHSC